MDKNQFNNWKKQWGLDLIMSPTEDLLQKYLDPTINPELLDIQELGQMMSVLSNFHFSLASEMGRKFASVRWKEHKADRAKLNMIKPIHDSLDLRISVLKKIYDRKVRKDMRSNNA